MKRVACILLCLVMVVAYLPTASYASAPTEYSFVTYNSDGSYCVTTITEETQHSFTMFATMQTKTGTKSQEYYNSNGSLLFTAYVRGTFQYNGAAAKATKSQAGHSISNSAWSYVSGSATYSGATATATCKFRASGLPDRTATVSLTCSANGTLS